MTAKASLPGDGYLFWSHTADSPTDTLDLEATSSNATCFLSGIGGNISEASASLAAGASVFVDSGGEWTLQVLPGTSGAEIEAHATCLWTTDGRITTTLSGNGTVTLTSASNYQCFLQAAWATDDSWGGADAKAVVSDGSGTWKLELSGVTSSAHATATCVQLPDVSYEMDNNETGTFTVPMMQTSTNPVACGIRGFEGAFTSSSDSVNMNWPGSTGDWQLVTTNSKVGWLTCLD